MNPTPSPPNEKHSTNKGLNEGLAKSSSTSTSRKNPLIIEELKDTRSTRLESKENKSEKDRNVEAVIVKSKRAAASLWMVLHAKGCCLPPTGPRRCIHQGCAETKLILLHVKSCAAGSDFYCPQNYHGCQQVRKLLAHYRRCRDLRRQHATQFRVNNGASSSQPHACLVCSLVVRHARCVLEGGKAPVPSITQESRSVSDTGRVVSSRLLLGSTISSSSKLKPLSSAPVELISKQIKKIEPLQLSRTDSTNLMPPPPPRPPLLNGSQPSCIACSNVTVSTCSKLTNRYRANSKNSQLDSHVVNSKCQKDIPIQSFQRRQRAGSVDERVMPSFSRTTFCVDEGEVTQLSNSAPKKFAIKSNDPTIELSLKNDKIEKPFSSHEEFDDLPSCKQVKRRSASCGMLSTMNRPKNCDPILDDGTNREDAMLITND